MSLSPSPHNPEQQDLIERVESLARELNPQRQAGALHAHSVLERDAGIDSLARVQLMERLEQAYGVRLDESQLFAAETIADLHQLLSGSAEWSPTMARQRDVRPETGAGVPHTADTLGGALEWHARLQPQRVHIHFYDDDPDRTRALTYGELWRRATAMAGVLRQRGLEPGQSVALMLPTGEDFFVCFCAIVLAGGVAVPIYPPTRAAQIQEHLQRQANILANAGARLLIAPQEAHALNWLLRGRVPSLAAIVTPAQLAAESGTHALPERSGQDLVLMQYTSGSTGQPKGVELSHANLLANIRAMGRALSVDGRDTFVSWLPLYHDMGLIGAWMGSLYHGIPLVVMSPLAFIARPQRWLWAIHRHHGTLSAAPNFAYELCVNKIAAADIEGLDLSHWRFTCNGAEPVSAATVRAFSERFSAYGFAASTMGPVYGLAECSVGLTFPPLGREPRIQRVQATPLRSHGRAEPAAADQTDVVEMVGCGMPLPGHEVRIIDEGGREPGDRRVGRIQFRGPSATRGYHDNPQANAALHHGDWLDSGDLGYLDGGELFVSGREKDLIIRAGRNLYPYDLEHAVGALPGIRRGGVAVFGSPDPEQGERLVVLAETREQRPVRRQHLREQIERLAMDLVQTPPDDVVLAPPRSVLKTSSGKIRRAACRELYQQGRLGRKTPLWAQLTRLTGGSLWPWMRRLGRSVGNALYGGWAWLLFALFGSIAWLGIMLLPGARLHRRILRACVHSALRLAGIGLRVYGRQHLNDAAAGIVVANHASYLDAMLLIALLPPGYGFVAKRELARTWLLRKFLERLDTHFVERFDPRQGANDMRRLTRAAKGGQALVFFPEGTFTRAPGLAAFRMGAFVAAARADLPVLPVALRGTRAVLRSGSWLPRRGDLEVEFLPPVRPDGDDWQAAIRLRDAARGEILAHCAEPDLAGH